MGPGGGGGPFGNGGSSGGGNGEGNSAPPVPVDAAATLAALRALVAAFEFALWNPATAAGFLAVAVIGIEVASSLLAPLDAAAYRLLARVAADDDALTHASLFCGKVRGDYLAKLAAALAGNTHMVALSIRGAVRSFGGIIPRGGSGAFWSTTGGATSGYCN